MTDLTCVFDLIAKVLPFDCMQAKFMQQAMLGLLLLAPMCAAMGVQVVNFRMAFFSDAISHSAFAGVAIGLLLAMDTRLTMIGLGLLVAIVSRDRHVARDLQRFLYGDILTIGVSEILWLSMLLVVLMTFQAIGYNKMLYLGLNATLAAAHRVRVGIYQYIFAALLSVVVIFSVWAVGVLLVTAMLVVPAATARNLARSAAGLFWWALAVSTTSAVAGLLISAQPWAHTATGATVILCSCAWFAISIIPVIMRRTSVRMKVKARR